MKVTPPIIFKDSWELDHSWLSNSIETEKPHKLRIFRLLHNSLEDKLKPNRKSCQVTYINILDADIRVSSTAIRGSILFINSTSQIALHRDIVYINFITSDVFWHCLWQKLQTETYKIKGGSNNCSLKKCLIKYIGWELVVNYIKDFGQKRKRKTRKRDGRRKRGFWNYHSKNKQVCFLFDVNHDYDI